jgi:hypothetical protein
MKLVKFLTENQASTFLQKAANVALGFVIDLIWVPIILLVIKLLDVSPTEVLPSFFFQFEESPHLLFFLAVICAPLWEEAAFRYAPYKIAQAFGKHVNPELGRALLIPIMIIATALFGWGHGYGIYSLLVQGVGGFIISCVYIKNGYSYWSSVALHALWNGSLMLLLPLYA